MGVASILKFFTRFACNLAPYPGYTPDYSTLHTEEFNAIQWNLSKADTSGTKNFVCCSEVSLTQGLVVDHAPPTITTSYDKALLWTTKKTVLMRDLSTDSS